MDVQTVKAVVQDLPHMDLSQAERMTQFIREQGIRDILELGFRHGVSTCYMAAAVADRGGTIVTIDRESARSLHPNVEDLLEAIGERQRVEVFYEPNSYNWRLMKFLEASPEPRFDLCYLDGAHTWHVDGLAFFLVNRLLRPGGWLILDDVDWSYATSSIKDYDFVRSLPVEEQTTPQVGRIYELLVKTHPEYHSFRLEDDWAYARKRTVAEAAVREREIIREEVVRVQRVHVGLGAVVKAAVSRLRL